MNQKPAPSELPASHHATAAPTFSSLMLASGLGWNELARRCGYRNLAKGCRRLQMLAADDLSRYQHLREPLARALGVDIALLDAAADAARAREREAAEAARRKAEEAWRKAFVPHVIWKTASSRPSSIALAAVIGVNQLLRFQPETASPLAMIAAAVKRCPARVPLFGEVTGFYVNLSPDLAMECDRMGSVVQRLGYAAVPGRAWLGFAQRRNIALQPMD